MSERVILSLIAILGTAVITGIISLISLIWSISIDIEKLQISSDRSEKAIIYRLDSMEHRLGELEKRVNGK